MVATRARSSTMVTPAGAARGPARRLAAEQAHPQRELARRRGRRHAGVDRCSGGTARRATTRRAAAARDRRWIRWPPGPSTWTKIFQPPASRPRAAKVKVIAIRSGRGRAWGGSVDREQLAPPAPRATARAASRIAGSTGQERGRGAWPGSARESYQRSKVARTRAHRPGSVDAIAGLAGILVEPVQLPSSCAGRRCRSGGSRRSRRRAARGCPRRRAAGTRRDRDRRGRRPGAAPATGPSCRALRLGAGQVGQGRQDVDVADRGGRHPRREPGHPHDQRHLGLRPRTGDSRGARCRARRSPRRGRR
jgi:hypothetical protein